MHPNDLNREVARVTGESVTTIAAMGFSLLTAPVPEDIPDQRLRLRKYHPRLAHEVRRSSRKPKSSSPSRVKRTKAARFHHDGQILPFIPVIRLVFFDKGA